MANNIYIFKKIQVAFIILYLFAVSSLSAQNHVSVPLEHRVYYVLEMAETRGLCSPLPAVKPYTRAKIIEILDEIQNAQQTRFGGLQDSEREIIDDILLEFAKEDAGFDAWKGMYRYEAKGKGGTDFSGQVGIAAESLNSIAVYEDDYYIGTDTWGTLYVNGDVGQRFSFNVDFSVGILRAQIAELGNYNSYASQMVYEKEKRPANRNAQIITYSHPLAFFPYSYQKRWDGYMFNLLGEMSAGTMEGWPHELAIAPSMLAEMSGTAFNDMLLLRAGRMQREWGAMTPGSSLVFNASARPFVGLELNFAPVPAFAFSSLTGVLEFDNRDGISEPALSFQNAFSIAQVELNYKNYFHIDLGSTAVWPKRFELGYLFPLLDNFYYQNFIGDFDNMAVFLNVKGQYPGLGKLWFSLFIDEVEMSSMKNIFIHDRHMFSFQTGLQAVIQGLPFASITASYTKIEPYTYTHTKEIVPWYGTTASEQAYVNNGVSLGHYLPPNSDEIKVKFDIQPLVRTSSFFQYQLIRHGADFGKQQVDGSSLKSELDKSERDGSKISLHKDFLNDGAYQWMHIVKIGAKYKFNSLPLTVFGEAGVVHTYFTTIDQDKYDRLNTEELVNPPEGSAHEKRFDSYGDYFKYTAFIFTIGFRVFK